MVEVDGEVKGRHLGRQPREEPPIRARTWEGHAEGAGQPLEGRLDRLAEAVEPPLPGPPVSFRQPGVCLLGQEAGAVVRLPVALPAGPAEAEVRDHRTWPQVAGAPAGTERPGRSLAPTRLVTGADDLVEFCGGGARSP